MNKMVVRGLYCTALLFRTVPKLNFTVKTVVGGLYCLYSLKEFLLFYCSWFKCYNILTAFIKEMKKVSSPIGLYTFA